MNPERWRKIERLYNDTLELEPAERAAFLDSACAGDDVLRREVLSLLSVDARAESFLKAPALEVEARRSAEERAASLVGNKLGPYEVLALLGAGGMGEVYRARDPRLDREVAIKVLPEHLSHNPEALARFQQAASDT